MKKILILLLLCLCSCQKTNIEKAYNDNTGTYDLSELTIEETYSLIVGEWYHAPEHTADTSCVEFKESYLFESCTNVFESTPIIFNSDTLIIDSPIQSKFTFQKLADTEFILWYHSQNNEPFEFRYFKN